MIHLSGGASKWLDDLLSSLIQPLVLFLLFFRGLFVFLSSSASIYVCLCVYNTAAVCIAADRDAMHISESYWAALFLGSLTTSNSARALSLILFSLRAESGIYMNIYVFPFCFWMKCIFTKAATFIVGIKTSATLCSRFLMWAEN